MLTGISSAIAAYKNGSDVGMLGKAAASGADGGFAETLKNFVGDAVSTLKEGEQMAAAGAAGEVGLQEVIMAVNNAEMMMTTVVALRDKVIGAYKEIMSMPI